MNNTALVYHKGSFMIYGLWLEVNNTEFQLIGSIEEIGFWLSGTLPALTPKVRNYTIASMGFRKVMEERRIECVKGQRLSIFEFLHMQYFVVASRGYEPDITLFAEYRSISKGILAVLSDESKFVGLDDFVFVCQVNFGSGWIMCKRENLGYRFFIRALYFERQLEMFFLTNLLTAKFKKELISLTK